MSDKMKWFLLIFGAIVIGLITIGFVSKRKRHGVNQTPHGNTGTTPAVGRTLSGN